MKQTFATTSFGAHLFRRRLPHVSFVVAAILMRAPFCTLAHCATHIINPRQSVQQTIDQSTNGDVIILKGGIAVERKENGR